MPEKCPACERVIEPRVIFKPDPKAGNYKQCPACGEILGEAKK